MMKCTGYTGWFKFFPMIGSFLFCSAAMAVDLYVSPSGSDSNSGTQTSKPLASLGAARDTARKVAGKEAVTVHVADGVYYLPETLVFTPADSGSAKCPIVYQADNEGKAVLSGGSKLDLQWKPHKDGVFQAATPAGLEIDQLFINGKNQRMARYPNYDANKKTDAYQGYAADAFSKERAANWADPTGGFIHAMHVKEWGGYHYLITGKDAKGEVTYEGGWQNNRKMGMHKQYRMVENIFEELDAPGEWFHNAKTSTLYYYPMPGTDLKTASVEVVRLRHLVEFQGSEQSPVQFITLQGFVVRHASRTFMDCKEQLLRSDWAIYRGGAFMLTGTEDVQILDCEFDQVGGNAIFVNNYNHRTLVKGCHIHDAGASGVCFVGDPDAVRNPLFEYGEKNDLATIDRTPGPKTQNFPSLGTVEDCLIHGIGRVERQPAGVMMDMASEITVRDCSIYDCARSGINIGDGAWGGHLIERCDVFDTVLETHDHGSFNSWGRDRYWRSDQKTSQAAVDAEPNLPFLDAVKTTTIRDSRWRCDHGWDIDLDDGSSNYDIYNNLLLNSGLKLREGFRRHAWNNIAPFGSLHPHVWYNGSKDQVYANIFAGAHRTARMSTPYTDGTMVDRNLFASQDQNILKRSAKLGWDKNSVLGDPMFIDPANGDFRVKDGSPALKLGFKNFPMDQFGVKKPALKAMAETPVIGPMKPVAKKASPKAAAKRVDSAWLGAVVHSLEGEEFSAYGTKQEEGGVALMDVPQASAAAKAGLKEGDLIQAVNGKPVATVEQLFKALSGVKSASVTLKVVRDQQEMELTVSLPAVVEIEAASAPNGFVKLPLPAAPSGTVTANQKISDNPIETLADGKLGKGYGPVFGNGIKNGAYKMDLGAAKSVAAITSWSFNMNRRRGAQKLTIYGSNSPTDPGWDLSTFTPIGTIDTGKATTDFTAASLRAPAGQSLGTFRWIVWAVSPVSAKGENTAYHELNVEVMDGAVPTATVSGEVPVPVAVRVKRPAPAGTPNIIFIYADDMGVGDVSHTTGLTPTPYIDRMAAEGMRFTDAHTASAVCTPSRYSALTGRYNWRTRLTAHVFMDPHEAPLIEPGEPTVASLLKDNGYHTACIGKWHMGIQWQLQENYKSTKEKPKGKGWDIDFSKPALITPTSHGFDSFYGITSSLDMPPYLYIDNEQAVITELTAKKGGRSGPMDAAFRSDGVLQCLAEKSVAYIDERAKEKQPFFLYLPLTSPHTPIVPSSAWKGKSGIGKYGDFLMETDWVVGEVLAALDQHGLAENTLVLFSTDNGCSPAAGIPNLVKQGHKPNGDYRGSKADIYDGGHRVPFIVRWPAQVKPGSVTDRLTCLTDFTRTCSDILGVELADHAGVDSVSFLPTLKDPSKTERTAVVHHSINGSFAIRQGDWKLVLCKGSGGWSAPKPGDSPADAPDVQLFNLAEDIGETKNLQAEYPERIKAMTELLKSYVEQGRSTEGPVQSNATDVNIYALPRKM